MSPQFVDFDGDGHLDIVAGTFDGSPHVSLGTEDGFTEPKHILDAEGNRILFNQYWDYGEKEWIYEDRDDMRHCTSAFAYDWDGDGDHDLVLGDYKGGRVFVNFNAGTNAEPKFSKESRMVEAGGKPIDFPDHLGTPRILDWDGDGKDDLLVSTMGTVYGKASGGAVWFFRNTSEKGEPRFESGVKLVGSSEPRVGRPVGPGGGFYFDATDYDADGDLDLLVGAKTTILPESRELSADEKQRADELKAVLDEIQKARTAIYGKASSAAMNEGELDRERYSAEIAKHQDELSDLTRRDAKARKEYDALVPKDKVANTVWLFRNQAERSSGTTRF